MKRIFITGGHFAPAKAVIQQLARRGNWEIFYVGRKYSLEGENAVAFEYSEIQQLSEVHYLTITTGRLQRQFLTNIIQSITSLLKTFIGLLQALFWIIKFHPDTTLSFGGYVAVPVVFWSWVFGIPIATHEQTPVHGRANKLISILATKVFVSWPDSLQYFPKGKVILIGNPIREEIIEAARYEQKGTSNKNPVIYVTGGNQGAHAINATLEKILPRLLEKYKVIHQVGISERFHDLERLQKIESKNYQLHRQLNGMESAKALASCDLVISRCGANITTEILFLGIPAILIPLPAAFGNEQEKNAKTIEDVGIGEILLQKDLTPDKLEKLVEKILANKNKYLDHKPQSKALVNPNAAKLIVDQIEVI